jgi:hypothetical protein
MSARNRLGSSARQRDMPAGRRSFVPSARKSDRFAARMRAGRRVFEGSFMCAPIDGRMGLSARTRVKTGHCSNAGGLSAV